MRRFVLALVLAAVSAAPLSLVPAVAATPVPAASGEGRIVIYFNDRHSGIEPARLQGARVLGAIVRDGDVLVPARRTFAQFGAVTTFDARTRQIRVRSARTIALAVGRNTISIDGEERPIDVAPRMEGGVLFVPIRVVVEALGGYVEWSPNRRAVALRYVVVAPPASQATPGAAVPEASAVPTTPSSPAPERTASPAPAKKTSYDRFLAGDVALAPRVANEFAPHVTGRTSGTIRAGLEYKFLGRGFAEIVYRRFAYPHGGSNAIPNGTPCGAPGSPAAAGDPGCVTPIGGVGSTYVSPTRLSEEQIEYHSSLYGKGHTYLAMSSLQRRSQYGYPRLGATFGVGAEILPQLERPVGFMASYYYYPELAGTYTPPGAPSQRLRYKLQTFTAGVHAALGRSPGFAEVGVYGDHYLGKENAPANATHGAIDAGVGIHF